MEILQNRSTNGRASKPGSRIERQSGELLAHLDALFRRLVLLRQPGEESTLELSREEIRAIVLLRSSGRSMMSDFASALGIPLSTATHTIDRLVHKGLVLRVRSEQDRRVVEVEMSEAGKELQAVMRAKQQAMALSWLEPLTPAERESFLSLMGKIAAGAAPQRQRTETNATRIAKGAGE